MRIVSFIVVTALVGMLTSCSCSKTGDSAQVNGGTEQVAGDDQSAGNDAGSEAENNVSEEAESSNDAGGQEGNGMAQNDETERTVDTRADAEREEARKKAEAEEANFAENISVRVENVSNRLLSKYEYEIYIENSNEVLSLQKLKMKVRYLNKKGVDLGKTAFERSIVVEPGETGMLEWSVDWVNLELGTKECELTVESVESNIGSFKDREV